MLNHHHRHRQLLHTISIISKQVVLIPDKTIILKLNYIIKKILQVLILIINLHIKGNNWLINLLIFLLFFFSFLLLLCCKCLCLGFCLWVIFTSATAAVRVIIIKGCCFFRGFFLGCFFLGCFFLGFFFLWFFFLGLWLSLLRFDGFPWVHNIRMEKTNNSKPVVAKWENCLIRGVSLKRLKECGVIKVGFFASKIGLLLEGFFVLFQIHFYFW